MLAFSQGLAQGAVDMSGSAGSASQPDHVRSDVAALVQSVREEDAKVHISLETPIKVLASMSWSLLALLVFCQAISFAALPTACYPASEPTDQLAALIAKVLCGFPMQQSCLCLALRPGEEKGNCQAILVRSSSEDVAFLGHGGMYMPSPSSLLAWDLVLGQASVRMELDKEDGEQKCEKALKEKRLDMIQWFSAYNAFALSAHACGMWDYTSAAAHLRNCLQVACERSLHFVCAGSFARADVAGRASASKMRHQLAQIYDETCRKEWSERSCRGNVYCHIPVQSHPFPCA